MIESSTSRPITSSNPISVLEFSVIPSGMSSSMAIAMRHRNGGQADQRAAPLAEEEEHGDPGEQDGEAQLLEHVVKEDADEVRVIVRGLELDAGIGLFQLVQLLVHGGDHCGEEASGSW